MPTKPQESLAPSATEAHQQRKMAQSFGADAERYDRARPHYPASLIEQIQTQSPGPDVLVVGSGTGIDARQFQAAGSTVLGVEPDARMADFARETGVETEVATFEAWESGGRTFNAVVAGQTWHWVDPVAGAAKAAQVLRSHGLLALYWNIFQPEPAVGEAFAEVYRRVLPDVPVFHRPMPGLEGYTAFLDKATDGIERTAAFDAPGQWRYDWDRDYTRDEWVYQVPTFGGHSHLAVPQLEELIAGIGAVIDAHGGTIPVHYVTVAVHAKRLDTATPLGRCS